MSKQKKLSSKQLNQLKYDGVVEEPKKDEIKKIAQNAVVKTIKDNYFATLMEGKKQKEEKVTVMPVDKEHLTENKIRLNEELMKRWIKVEKEKK